uniref:Hypothetical conserved protein n=1 Tax=Acetithermum autotrophicum TaxID=1446466 RepID=H5SRL6_ACEAU|nr:hypothetical conserved protein [Candidatus Acetothermum autotrophicum]
MENKPFELETRISEQITVKTVKEKNCYVSYGYQHWQTEEILGVYQDELSAREGHLRWVKHNWAKLERKRQLRLLVAEDNPDDLKIAKKAFQRAPATWETVWIEDGQQALDFLFKQGKYSEAWTPDLIILNLNMPKWSGHEILAKMKEDGILRQIPVVIWTVSQREEDIRRAYELGASAYLAKARSTKEAIEDLMALRRFFERVCFLGNVG